jgi:hypothetical protein
MYVYVLSSHDAVLYMPWPQTLATFYIKVNHIDEIDIWMKLGNMDEITNIKKH